jgi:hypothetical protein
MKVPVNDPVAFEQQGKPERGQDPVRDKINIRNPGAQNNYPGSIPPGILIKNHADKDCKGCGVDNVFREHDGGKIYQQTAFLRFLCICVYILKIADQLTVFWSVFKKSLRMIVDGCNSHKDGKK